MVQELTRGESEIERKLACTGAINTTTMQLATPMNKYNTTRMRRMSPRAEFICYAFRGVSAHALTGKFVQRNLADSHGKVPLFYLGASF